MLFIRHIFVDPYQRGVVFRNELPVRVLGPGHHLVLELARQVRLRIFDVREPYLPMTDLEALIKVAWIEGRSDRRLGEVLRASASTNRAPGLPGALAHW